MSVTHIVAALDKREDGRLYVRPDAVAVGPLTTELMGSLGLNPGDLIGGWWHSRSDITLADAVEWTSMAFPDFVKVKTSAGDYLTLEHRHTRNVGDTE